MTAGALGWEPESQVSALSLTDHLQHVSESQ